MELSPIQPTADLAALLESPNESRALEFKPGITWPATIDVLRNTSNRDSAKAREIACAILAMSNNRDGGRIVIGVAKNGAGRLAVSGLTPAQVASFDPDKVQATVRSLGYPEPRFELQLVLYSGFSVIVVSVQRFNVTPVVSRNGRNIPDIKTAAIYIRTDQPASKAATEPDEIQEVLDLAIDLEFERLSPRVRALGNSLLPILLAAAPQPAPPQGEDPFSAENSDLELPEG